MRIYLVGGAVRDSLLGIPVKDRDWVVVGATPEQMSEKGFKPVGADFPVFLHPETKEEYALARTERKTGAGYKGFVFHTDPNVSIETDLSRRDLTINAMAMSDDGRLIDRHNGKEDLVNKVLRHTSKAFSEDPVRILRVARFAARHPGFTVAPETMQLMREMVADGQTDTLVAERVWKELGRGLMEQKPSRMFETLRECGALERLFPELDRLWGVPQPPLHHPEVDTGVHVMMVVDMAARMNHPMPVRFAALCHDLGKGTTPADKWPKHAEHEKRSAKLLDPVCVRWKVPTDHRSLAKMVAYEHGNVHASMGFDAGALMRLLDRCDAIRRPDRFADVLKACECDARGRLGLEENPYPQAPRLLQALSFAKSINTAAMAEKLANNGLKGAAIGEAIFGARVKAIESGFERMRIEADPQTAKEAQRKHQNDQVRRKIKQLRYVLLNNGNPQTEKTTGNASAVRQALRATLELREHARKLVADSSHENRKMSGP